MQKVYIVAYMTTSTLDKVYDIIGVTMNVSDIPKIIHKYLDKRIANALDDELTAETNAAEYIKKTIAEYDFSYIEVGQSRYAGYLKYGIEVSAHALFQSDVTCADCDYYKSDTDNCCIGEDTTCCEFVQRKCYG